MNLKPSKCDGDCGRPAESTARGYKMVSGHRFWCGCPECAKKIQEKIYAGYVAYDKFRRGQTVIRNENEKFYKEHPEEHPDVIAEKEARHKVME